MRAGILYRGLRPAAGRPQFSRKCFGVLVLAFSGGALLACADPAEPDLAAKIGSSLVISGLTITVTNTNDVGSGTLREALSVAPEGATIDFDPSLAGQTIDLSTPLTPTDFQTVSIVGPAAPPITISGGDQTEIFFVPANAVVTMQNLVLTNGYGGAHTGGAIENLGTLTFVNGTITDSHTFGSGGAIQNVGVSGGSVGDLTVINSAIAGNSAMGGGGIESVGDVSIVTLTNTTISDNTATTSGGGLSIDLGTLNLGSTTIAGNTAPAGAGGGLQADNATLGIDNSILAYNTGGDCYKGTTTTSVSSPIVVADASCLAQVALTGDPLLGPLADNGGPTKTRALLPGSFAIDAGACSAYWPADHDRPRCHRRRLQRRRDPHRDDDVQRRARRPAHAFAQPEPEGKEGAGRRERERCRRRRLHRLGDVEHDADALQRGVPGRRRDGDRGRGELRCTQPGDGAGHDAVAEPDEEVEVARHSLHGAAGADAPSSRRRVREAVRAKIAPYRACTVPRSRWYSNHVRRITPTSTTESTSSIGDPVPEYRSS
jgi:hypothetical protein